MIESSILISSTNEMHYPEGQWLNSLIEIASAVRIFHFKKE